jgi:hypothetical protein
MKAAFIMPVGIGLTKVTSGPVRVDKNREWRVKIGDKWYEPTGAIIDEATDTMVEAPEVVEKLQKLTALSEATIDQLKSALTAAEGSDDNQAKGESDDEQEE